MLITIFIKTLMLICTNAQDFNLGAIKITQCFAFDLNNNIHVNNVTNNDTQVSWG